MDACGRLSSTLQLAQSDCAIDLGSKGLAASNLEPEIRSLRCGARSVYTNSSGLMCHCCLRDATTLIRHL